jgi:hypothetical protein
MVHIRQYRDHFTVVPEHSSLQGLEVAIGHLPLSARMDPNLIQTGEVSDEELDGYRYWQEEGGGYSRRGEAFERDQGGRTSMNPAAEKSPSNASASRNRRLRISAKLVESTNE